MKRFLLALALLACTRNTSVVPPAEAAPPSPAAQPAVVAQNLEVPWSLAFAPDGRIFVTERPGRVRVIENGKLRAEPLHVVRDVESRAETGLMGLALHPDFAKNHLLYLAYATSRGGRLVVDVVRFRETGSALADAQPIVRNIPAARFHAGCRLQFGPDRKLYITTGDATDREIAQDLSNLGGKILRVNDDGSVPSDNPFKGSPVWTLGHRNPQGIAWDPVSGLLFSTEHGPSGFDGGSGGDEVNIIERGRNYGWPVIHHRDTRAGMISPLLEYTPACAPASAAFWRGDLYFGCLRGEHLHRVVLDPKNRRKVLREEKLFTNLGRIREVAVGRDGALYFTTSNRDGRGDPDRTDDRIFVLRNPL
ncbi:MAG TPA: PQQ-dependent sugar dehydrogenase [Thermoanaerobaculia bacterium]|nr:PQQ-dependent sugar dehydrogenase [Thermoanaerobaculia bacterium]